MTKEQKELESALLLMIERESRKPSENMELVPQMAHELNFLWSITRENQPSAERDA
jgi:hypothetical protein